MTKTKSTYLALLTVVLSPMAANADLITVDPGNGATTTFTQTGLTSDSGPVILDGISVSGTTLVYGDTSYGLAENGSWSEFSWVANNSPDGSITFDLGGLFGFVGGFMNYAPCCGIPIIEALAADMSVLESFDLSVLAAISTPGGFNEGAFRGIERAEGDIAFFRLTGGFLLTHDLTRGDASAVPEPGTLALLGIGLFGMGLARRKKV